MAATTRPDTVLLFDDEPHNLQYVIDYIEFKSLKCLVAQTADDAVALLEAEIYRSIIVDLNIPMTPRLAANVANFGNVYLQYPGLYVANFARNKGYRGKQVLVYSVHKDEAVVPEARKLGFAYLIKGRPLEIKAELDDVLSFDPTAPVPPGQT